MRRLAALCLLAALAQAQEPLPLTRSAKLARNYTLTGRKTLAKGVRLLLQKGVRVVGQGKGAVIDVKGNLETSGLLGQEVVFENVWLNLDGGFNRIGLAHTRFLGKGGIFTPHESQVSGKLFLEDVAFRGEASLWVIFHEGSLKARRVSSESSCQIAGTHPDRNFNLDISECVSAKGAVSGFHGGLRLHNVKDVRLSAVRIGGHIASFRGCTKLVLEGCKFEARAFAVRQDKKGRFAKTKIRKCDISTEMLRFYAPKGAKERVTLDDCYFKGDAAAKPRDIAVKRTAGTGVRVIVKAPSEQPHNLAGADKPK